MKRYIKFMVGPHSLEKVEQELDKIGIAIAHIDYGVVKFYEKLDSDQSLKLSTALPKVGLEVLDPVSSELLDQAFGLIDDFVYEHPEMDVCDYPSHLEEKLHCSEFEINRLFSQIQGTSVCQFARLRQVERIKELILYHNLDLNQISEIFHLKNDTIIYFFREITGLSPAYFKRLRDERIKFQNRYGRIEKICTNEINTAN